MELWRNETPELCCGGAKIAKWARYALKNLHNSYTGKNEAK
jgi:hypothetical protein